MDFKQAKEPESVGEWLDLCDVDLAESEIPWPLDKLNELPDLRTQAKQTQQQCTTWHIFKDERAAQLPSLERVVNNLKPDASNGAWRLNRRIRLGDDHVSDWKVRLCERQPSRIRLLNVSVTGEMVGTRQ